MVRRCLWVLLTFAIGSVAACDYKSTATIDAPAPPTIGFEFATSGADEGTGTTKIPVVLSKPSDTPVTVNFTTLASETATLVDDFELMSNKLTFDPGVTRLEIPVLIKSDFDETESAETVELALADPVGADLDQVKAIHEIVIADHLLPRVNFSTTTTTSDEGVKSQLTVMLNAPSEGESTVVIGVTPMGNSPADSEDLGLTEGTVVTFAPGAMSQTVNVDETDDALDEQDGETVQFDLKGASINLVLGTTTSDVHTITDNDDPPTVEFLDATSNANEADGTKTLTIKLSGESAKPITVNYARNATSTAKTTDADVVGTSVSFAPHTLGTAGETMKTITVNVTDDVFDEDNETCVIDLTPADLTTATLGNNSTHVLTVLADATDPPPTVTFDAPTSSTVDEDAANSKTYNFPVSLNVESGKTVTVQTALDAASTATSGTDFTFTAGTLTFTPGQTTKTVSITVKKTDPPNSEPNETAIVDLTNPSNCTVGTADKYTLTITE